MPRMSHGTSISHVYISLGICNKMTYFDSLASLLIRSHTLKKLSVCQKALQLDRNDTDVSQATQSLCVQLVIMTCHHNDKDDMTLRG